jgi:hypothetical protein
VRKAVVAYFNNYLRINTSQITRSLDVDSTRKCANSHEVQYNYQSAKRRVVVEELAVSQAADKFPI